MSFITIEKATLKNFRCFGEKQEAHLAPLTLLVGDNSTGKTSFLAAVRMLWDLAFLHRIPDFKEEPYDLGSFDEISHFRGGKPGRAKTFELNLDALYKERNSEKTGVYEFKSTFMKYGTVPVPVRRRVSDQGMWIEYEQREHGLYTSFGTPNGSWKIESPTGGLDFLNDRDMDLIMFPILFNNTGNGGDNIKQITKKGAARPSKKDWEMIQGFSIRLHRFRVATERAFASAPVRSNPKRTYDPARATRDPEGDRVPMYLAEMSFKHERRWATLQSALQKFGKDAGLFDEILVRTLGNKESNPFQIQVRRYDNGAKGPHRNLIDVGYGVSQVLPIITELLRPDALPLFLLQQPEVHLHPSAQAALGTLFCEVAGPKRQLVVETHSDYLLDRVRMDIRDKKTNLKPEDVSILFFERGNLDVVIHSLIIDEQGNIRELNKKGKTGNVSPGYRKFFMEETTRSLGVK